MSCVQGCARGLQRVSGAGTRAVEELKRAGVEFTLHEYDDEQAIMRSGRDRDRRPSYGEDAAAALGVDPRRIFKTLVASVDGRLVVAIVPVAGELDLKRLAAVRGGRRADLADPVAAERSSGYVVGGISPLGQRRKLPTVLDASALEWPTVYVSGGRRGLQIEVSPAALLAACGGIAEPIGRLAENGDEAKRR